MIYCLHDDTVDTHMIHSIYQRRQWKRCNIAYNSLFTEFIKVQCIVQNMCSVTRLKYTRTCPYVLHLMMYIIHKLTVVLQVYYSKTRSVVMCRVEKNLDFYFTKSDFF